MQVNSGKITREKVMTDTLETAETKEGVDIEIENTEPVVDDADIDESESEADFTDDEEEGEELVETEAETKPPQKEWKNAENAEQARKRREKESEAKIKQVKLEAIKEALDGVNPYTGNPIEDETDMNEYLTMKEIDKAGKDPISDYSGYIKEKQKAESKASKEVEISNEWVAKDRTEFIAKYPKIKLNELINDELFATFASGKIGKMPMTQIYSDYQTFNKLSEDRAKNKAAQILANNASTPGKLSNHETKGEKAISEMTKAEFEKMIEKVKRGER
jgi:hypothetical protein